MSSLKLIIVLCVSLAYCQAKSQNSVYFEKEMAKINVRSLSNHGRYLYKTLLESKAELMLIFDHIIVNETQHSDTNTLRGKIPELKQFFIIADTEKDKLNHLSLYALRHFHLKDKPLYQIIEMLLERLSEITIYIKCSIFGCGICLLILH